ncbi:MAG TPA: hypothetical protein VKS78_04600 [Roseiarcus sp.]|nr:hypothetical protein [Roseiarcus sp.]
MLIVSRGHAGRLSLALTVALAIIATTSQASSLAVHPGAFGGVRFAHGMIHGAPGFRFAPGGRFAFDGFHHHGTGRFFGPLGAFGLGDVGYFAPGSAYPAFYGPGELDAGEPTAVGLTAGGYGGDAGSARGYRGDCQIHRLIYGRNGRYLGQRVIEACDRGL